MSEDHAPTLGAGLELLPVDGVGEVGPGTDLGALLARLPLRDGDVVVLTSKVVSKAEGRATSRAKDDVVAEQTRRVVARRATTLIVENLLGVTMAAAGVDASNVTTGEVLALPVDPDATARALRTHLQDETGRNVAVVVSDTAGRAWRTGQTDLALGVAGLDPLDDHAGRVDGYGNPLAVTAPAVADELAGAAELATGKLSGRPACVVRGLAGRVLPAGEHGPGAGVLVRPRAQDMFALGTREAVVAALLGTDADCFGAPVPVEELVDLVRRLGLPAEASAALVRVPVTTDEDRLRVRLLAHAVAWRARAEDGAITLVPESSAPLG